METQRSWYDDLGSVDQFPELKCIWEALVERKHMFCMPDATGVQVRRFKGGKLLAVDWKGIRYLEQNPGTYSDYAKRAREGAKIAWVIRKRDDAYLGYIEEGNVFMKPKKKKE